jgi:hypothetical protein
VEIRRGKRGGGGKIKEKEKRVWGGEVGVGRVEAESSKGKE